MHHYLFLEVGPTIVTLVTNIKFEWYEQGWKQKECDKCSYCFRDYSPKKRKFIVISDEGKHDYFSFCRSSCRFKWKTSTQYGQPSVSRRPAHSSQQMRVSLGFLPTVLIQLIVSYMPLIECKHHGSFKFKQAARLSYYEELFVEPSSADYLFFQVMSTLHDGSSCWFIVNSRNAFLLQMNRGGKPFGILRSYERVSLPDFILKMSFIIGIPDVADLRILGLRSPPWKLPVLYTSLDSGLQLYASVRRSNGQ